MRFQNIIFNMYGTLIDIHTDEESPLLWEKMSRYFTAYGATYRPEPLRKRFHELIHQEVERVKQERGCEAYQVDIRLEPVFAQLLSEKGMVTDEQMAVHMCRLFRSHSLEYVRLYDGAEELLQRLRCAGHNLFLMSNAQVLFSQAELRQFNLSRFFDGIFVSSEYGFKKPDRRFYQQLIDSHGLDSRSTIMIGNDGPRDIEGAKSVGITTLYVYSNISPSRDSNAADYVLDEWDIDKIFNILNQD